MLACAGEGASVSDMTREASASHNRISSILGMLVSSGLMEQRGGRLYRTSAKGRNFLQEYRTFQRFSETFGMNI